MEGVRVDGRALDRVQLTILRDPLDRLDGLSLARDREGHARVDGATVDEDGASATRSLVTDLFCPGEREGFAQRVQERPPGRCSDLYPRAVDGERDIRIARTAQHDTAC